jgi:hypothetical protein
MSEIKFIYNERNYSDLLRDYILGNTAYLGRFNTIKEHWIVYSINNKCIEGVLIISYSTEAENTSLFSLDYHSDNSDVGKKLFFCLLQKINIEKSETARLAKDLVEFVGDVYNGDKMGCFNNFSITKKYNVNLFNNSYDSK